MRSTRTIVVALLPSRGYAEVINEEEPVLVESSLEDREHELLEVLWAVCRSEGKSAWQPAPSGAQHCHFLTRLRFVVHLVEAFFEVSHRNKVIASHRTLDVVGVGDEEELADGHFIQGTIVYHHSA